MNKVKDALILFLEHLPVDSYFNVHSFGTRFEILFEKSVKNNYTNIQKAICSIRTYNADLGGTNIYEPVKFAFE